MLAACSQPEPPGSGAPAARVVPAVELSYVAERGESPDQRLVSWSFDGRPSVPCRSTAPRVEIDWGCAGVTPRTTLYLPLDEGEGTAVGGAPPELDVTLAGCSWTDGRFGAGLELTTPRASLVARLGGAPLLRTPWSLHLWVRPAAGGTEGVLASAPGALELTLQADLRCRLVVPLPTPLTLVAKSPLAQRGWNRVSVVCDGPDLRQVRLIVNQETLGALRASGEEVAPAAQLTLGSPAPDRPGLVGSIDDVVVEARAATSAECMEAQLGAPSAGEHRLRLVRAGGEEEVRLWAGILSVPELRTVEEWGSGERRHFQAGADGLRWVPAHWDRDHPPDPPLARTTHPIVFLGNHQAFLFGGETRDSHLPPMVNTNDTWIYHLQEARWEELAGAPAPIPRCHQPAAYSPDHDVVFYFGGWRNDERYVPAPEAVDIPRGQVFRDTWLFDCARRAWRQVRPGQWEAPTLSDATIVYHPPSRRFLVFSSGRFWTFDPATERWQHLPAPRVVGPHGDRARLPPGGSTMGGYDPATGLIVLFGSEHGQPDGSNLYGNATSVYDVAANVLTLRAPDPVPLPRVRSGFAYSDRLGVFVLFGGVQGQFKPRHGDLWTYHVGQDRWTEVEASNPPSSRGGYFGMAYDPELDVFALLGGRHAGNRFLNEAWRLRLDPRAEARAAFVFDRAAFPALERVRVDWEGPPGSELALELALSSDGRTWSALAQDARPAPADAARFVKLELRARPDAHAIGPAIRALGFVSGSEAPLPAGRQRIVRALPAFSPVGN